MNDDLNTNIPTLKARSKMLDQLDLALNSGVHTERSKWIIDDSAFDAETIQCIDNFRTRLAQYYQPEDASKQKIAEILTLL